MIVAVERRLLVNDVLHCDGQQHEAVAEGDRQLLHTHWDALPLRRDPLRKSVQKCPDARTDDLPPSCRALQLEFWWQKQQAPGYIMPYRAQMEVTESFAD